MMDAEDTDHVVDYINEGILQELREAPSARTFPAFTRSFKASIVSSIEVS